VGRIRIVTLCALAGCWKTGRSELPEGVVDFVPAAGGPAGWVVERYDFPENMLCPDDNVGAYYFVYPEGVPGPFAGALVLHSGAFDYVPEPSLTDPLAGDHFQDPSRLDADWSVRRVFATLGMYEDPDETEEVHTGALPAALATANVAMVLPANCWADWWHNKPGVASNDFATEQFDRQGRFAAEWAYRMVSEPGFPTANRLQLPAGLTFDTSRVYMVGLGEGGRGVSELLHDAALIQPTAVAIDSSVDDLRPFYDDAALYQVTIDGLGRLFPDGRDSTIDSSLSTAPAIPKIAYVYSSLDTEIPVGAHDAALARLAGMGGNASVTDVAVARHVLLNSDLLLAQQTVTFVTTP
jgi:hypothetical protein